MEKDPITKQLEKTKKHDICFGCEKEKPKYPGKNPIFCAKCFVEPFKMILENKKERIETKLLTLEKSPDNFLRINERKITNILERISDGK